MLPSPSLQLSLSRCSLSLSLPRRPAIASPPSPFPSVLLFPTTCTFSVAIPHRGVYRCTDAHSHARVARSRTFTQPRIEHRLPALTGRVQRSLGSHRLALSRPGRSAWFPPPLPLLFSSFSPFSSPLPLPPLSLFGTRALAPSSIATSLVPLISPPTLRISFCLFLPLILSFCPPSLLFSHL